MANALRALIQWYRTGDDADRAKYDIAWVQDKDSTVDTINGFIEVYMDPRGIKGSWEALVFYVNQEKTGRDPDARRRTPSGSRIACRGTRRIASRTSTGIVANAIDVVVETGDSGPVTPVGINLPNDQRIREQYGSKSISLTNVREAYDNSTPSSMRSEFAWSPEESARAEKFGALAAELLTDMHEVIGHASGRQKEGLAGTPQALIKEHFSALEEGRADLIALYFLPDPKLVELGIIPAADQDAIVRAEYEAYTRNALVQLRRVREGTQIEEDHMRNRQMIVRWLMANTKAIEERTRDGKRYLVDGRPGRVPRRRGAPAGRSAAHQVRGRRRRRGEAVRHLRDPFRPEAARRGGEARGRAEPSVLYRLRHAEADAGRGRRWQDHRRHDLLPDGSDDADAGVLGSSR